jgi:hypothetical protein
MMKAEIARDTRRSRAQTAITGVVDSLVAVGDDGKFPTSDIVPFILYEGGREERQKAD